MAMTTTNYNDFYILVKQGDRLLLADDKLNKQWVTIDSAEPINLGTATYTAFNAFFTNRPIGLLQAMLNGFNASKIADELFKQFGVSLNFSDLRSAFVSALEKTESTEAMVNLFERNDFLANRARANSLKPLTFFRWVRTTSKNPRPEHLGCVGSVWSSRSNPHSIQGEWPGDFDNCKCEIEEISRDEYLLLVDKTT
jgi:hypothetical protein